MTHDAGPTLVPLDSDPVQPGFDIVLRGYDRGQVDRQIAWLEEQLASGDREMEAVQESLRQTKQEAVELRRHVDKISAELDRGRPTFEALGERVAQILTLAEEEADALRAAARADVERIHGELAAEQQATRRQLQEQRRAAEQDAATIVAQAKQEGQRIVTEARRHAAETTAAAERQVDAMSRQRDAIHAELVRVRDRFAAVMGATGDAPAEQAADQPVAGPRAARPSAPASDHPPAQGPAQAPAQTPGGQPAG